MPIWITDSRLTHADIHGLSTPPPRIEGTWPLSFDADADPTPQSREMIDRWESDDKGGTGSGRWLLLLTAPPVTRAQKVVSQWRHRSLAGQLCDGPELPIARFALQSPTRFTSLSLSFPLELPLVFLNKFVAA